MESGRLTWEELDRGAREVAAALRRVCAPGDRALLLYPPSLDFVVAFFGCLYAGVVAVPAYPPRPRRDQPRLRSIVEDACPRVVLTTPSLLAGAEEIQAREPSLAVPRWLATGGEEIAEAESAGWPDDPRPEAPAFLQYTSGSTALPKGVVVTHANLMHNERAIQQAFGTGESSVVVGWLPLYHDMGLIGNVLQPLYCGGSCVLMAPAAFLQRPRRWLEAISRYRGTTSGGPNFAYELCVQKIPPSEREELDLRSWSVAFNGAEPVRAGTLERFAAAFAPCGFAREALYPCYGLAEATLFVTGGRPGEGARTATVSAEALTRHEVLPVEAGDVAALRLVSSGRTAVEQRVLIVDPETRVECPPGRVGEIWVSGPSVAAGYWARPEVSASELRAPLADGSGSFLRTGDLGFLQGGELYVTGRRKDLIILRGRNHYPQDLELTAERSHAVLRPGGGAAFAIEIHGEERLVLVFEADRHALAAAPVEEVAAAVRQALAEEHEVQLYDLVLIRQGSLPKTSSGKVQRHACRVLYETDGLAVVGRHTLGEAPAEERPTGKTATSGTIESLEDVLRTALARVVRIDPARIDRERAMSSFGLDSLGAVELRNEVEAELGAAPSITELLEGISIAAAAQQLAAVPAAARPLRPSADPAAGDPARHPLSFGQQALWILYGLEPASAAYNIAGAARLAGGFDAEVLGRAFQALVDRHPALRTTFEEGPAGPVQQVRMESPAAFVREDAAGWGAEELRRRVHEAAYRPFDLAAGPVLRVVLFDRGPGDPQGSVLVLAVHHIAADFWSLSVLLRELGELHARGGRAELPAPAASFAELVERQERERAAGGYEEMLGAAQRQLAGAPALDLSWDRPRPALQTFGGTLQRERLGPGLTEALRALARRRGATLFMTLLAGFEALLARHGGQEDFLIGTPTAGRSSRELEGLVGYLVNPVPVRADLSGDPDVRTLLQRARDAALTALARQDLPFTVLAEGLGQERDPSRPAVVQAMLVLQRAAAPELEPLTAFALGAGGARLHLGGLTLESVELENPSAQLDVTLLAGASEDDLTVALQVNSDLFDAVTARRMLRHGVSLLAAMTGDETRRLSELAMLSPAETQQVLREWNATDAAAPAVCLHELVEAQAESTPDAAAVVFEEESLTYRTLNARANQLADQLMRLGVGPEVRVGIRLERSTSLMVGLLATLKAGGAFVPIDPSYPAERVAYMLEDSRVPVVLTHERSSPALPAHARRVAVDGHAPWRQGLDPGNPARGGEPDHLAYVIYTSGSTGRPKGAMNSHRGIVNRLGWMQASFPLTPADRVLQKTPISFDVSVWELFWPVTTGACLVMARPGGHLDPPYLRDEIAARDVSMVHFVPSLLQVFLEQPGLAARTALRRVFVSGEAISRDLVTRFHASLGRQGVELHNLYGPTEAAIEVTWWACPAGDDGRSVPIGRPIANTRIHVLDRHLRAVPAGVAGELHIGGVQVARGYLERPDLTAERFIPDPFAADPGGRLYRTGDLVRHRTGGELEFLRRIDHQVKIRGVRIELGEVEAALTGHEAVREAVVRVWGEAERARLTAYVVPAGEAPDAAVLRQHLRDRLPEAMIPSAWLFLPGLPLSPSGKVDRKALPEPELAETTAPFAAPGTPAEETLVRIWSEILGREHVGIHDNFFVLGGDSILAMQVLSRAAQAGLRLTPREIFRNPTISELAAVAVTIEGGEAEQGPVDGEVPLTPIQRWFFELDLPAPHHWNWTLATMLSVEEPRLPGVLEEALHRLALHHDALRLRFSQGPEGWRQRYVDGAEKIPCTRIDLSALPAPLRPAALDRAVAQAHASLDLGRGPLLRAVLLDVGHGSPARLLLAVHHLVVDGISWRILLEDLETSCRQLLARRAVSLPARTSSYQSWARRLLTHARGDGLADEAAYWLAQGEGAEPYLHSPHSKAASREASARTIRCTLSREDTDALLYQVHDAYNTRIDDLLRTALVRAFGRSTGRRSLLLDLESHGREDLFGGLDVSRTVGWFTSIYRVRLDLGGAVGPGEELCAIKEQGRRIPAGGMGYGLLRHLAGDAGLAAGLRNPQAEVLFNYLGQLGQPGQGELMRSGGALLTPSAEPTPHAIDPAGRRTHRWIVNCWIAAGRLEVEWGYGAEIDSREAAERLANDFVGELATLIDHCRDSGAGAYTVSDFPDADLSDRDFQKLMSKLGSSERGSAS